MKKHLILKLCIIPFVVGVDILTKNLFQDKDYPFLKGFISIHSSQQLNYGGAWGILGDHTWILIIISLLFLVFLVLFDLKMKPKNTLYTIAFCFIIGGALGNLIDRIFLGGVRDFICFDFWPSFPTFNLADSFLCIGVILFAIYLLFFYKSNGEEKK